MRLSARIAVPMIWIAVASAVFAQSATPNTALFETVSIKVDDPKTAPNRMLGSPASLTFTRKGAPLSALIAQAYGVPGTQIEGLPEWNTRTSYSIAAKPYGDKPLSKEQLQLALQQLLQGRFHLAVHHVTKQVDGYALVKGKHEPKLEICPANLEKCQGTSLGVTLMGTDGFESPNISLPEFAKVPLTLFIGRPVIDTTGIEGRFDIKLTCALDSAVDSPLPSIFTAVEEQLGLKLVSQKVPVDIIVIDHVDREPVEN